MDADSPTDWAKPKKQHEAADADEQKETGK